jgi:hypothetical protein
VAITCCPSVVAEVVANSASGPLHLLWYRGFRRVTSDRIPLGIVAFYHNSFRREEQELLKTMGIGKKNDPEVQDVPAFGLERAAGTGVADTVAAPPPAAPQPMLSTQHVAAPALSAFHSMLGQSQPAAETTNTAASAQRVNYQVDPQSLLLQVILAHHHQQQRQTDAIAVLQQRQVSASAENLLQSQQRSDVAISNAAAAGGGNNNMALAVRSLLAHVLSNSSNQLQAQPQAQPGRPVQNLSGNQNSNSSNQLQAQLQAQPGLPVQNLSGNQNTCVGDIDDLIRRMFQNVTNNQSVHSTPGINQLLQNLTNPVQPAPSAGASAGATLSQLLQHLGNTINQSASGGNPSTLNQLAQSFSGRNYNQNTDGGGMDQTSNLIQQLQQVVNNNANANASANNNLAFIDLNDLLRLAQQLRSQQDRRDGS